jgi:hypothetical protein
MSPKYTRPATFLAFLRRVPGIRLTPAQVVLVKVSFDAVDPCDLEGDERELSGQLFGDCERIPSEARTVVAWLKGARIGGTWLCAMYLVYAALTADLDGLALGEMAFAIIVAPDLKTARQALRFALGLAKQIAPWLIVSETADGFVLRREDGRLVSIECLAASRGGSAVRGRSMVAALMDESAFFRDADSGVVNDSEIFRALVVRIRAGGILCVISTAWMKSGLLMDLVEKNHGAPQSAVAAIAPTTLVRTDSLQLARIIDEERSRDPLNAAREFECVPFDGGAAAFIPASAIDAMVDESLPLEGAP